MDFNPDTLLIYLDEDLQNSRTELDQMRMDCLRQSILKKFVPSTAAPSLHREALDNFICLNNDISKYRVSESFKSSSLFSTWRGYVYDALMSHEYQTTISIREVLSYGACGPGSSRNIKDTSFLTKMFASPLTTTSDFLHRNYVTTISDKWLKAEEIRANNFGTKIVKGSMLTSVPKDRTKNRTTCTEPTLNMFYQLGVKHYLERVLSNKFHWSIDGQPEINKRLACIGSIDGSLATIDLKNASDSVSLELCHAILPKPFLDILLAVRSPSTMVNNVEHNLNMIGTMGNGFTFHLMTLIFSALVKAIYREAGLCAVMGTNYSVVGDDIIILTEFVPQLYEALREAGFVVNQDKSFTTGFFRESCGGDFYRGHNVRGIYIKELNNETDVYSAFNRLHFWSLRNNICLHRSLRYLKGLAKFQPVPRHASFDSGFIVTSRELTSPKRNKFGHIYYRCSEPIPFKVKLGDSYVNPIGAEIAFLGSFIRDNKISLRSNRTRYQVKKRTTPNWDSSFLADFAFDRSSGYRVILGHGNMIEDSGIFSRDVSASWSVLLST